MKALYNIATGEIVGIGAVNVITDHAVMDARGKFLPGEKDPELYHVVDNEIVRKDQAEIDAILHARAIPPILVKLNEDLHSYLDIYYDAGTQRTFTAIFANPSTSQTIKDRIEGIWDWIDTVLTQYYTWKATIEVSADPSSETWDFTSFDATIPKYVGGDNDGKIVTLRLIKAEMAAE